MGRSEVPANRVTLGSPAEPMYCCGNSHSHSHQLALKLTLPLKLPQNVLELFTPSHTQLSYSTRTHFSPRTHLCSPYDRCRILRAQADASAVHSGI
jgi:hypothetical protein